MNVVEKLDALRAAAPGCSLAAFGDLRTRLVLRSSAERPWPQERLDELCTLAAQSFASVDSAAVADHFMGGATERLNEVIVAGTREIRLFLRSPNDDSDLICVVCKTSADLNLVAGLARQTVMDI